MSINHGDTIIAVRDLSFAYGKNKVLTDITLDIHRGDYMGVVGPNGGGKTTLIKLILGLLKPTTGTISLFGKEIASFRDWKKVGYVAQKATNIDPLFPITVREVVSLGLSGNRDDKVKVDTAIEQVGMSDYPNRLIGDLSGGQQQRVFIARALAQHPEIIFLDEPTSGVDASSQEQFYVLLKRLNKDLGITMVLVSHDVDVITSEVTEIACVNQTLTCHIDPKGTSKEILLKDIYAKGQKFVVHHH